MNRQRAGKTQTLLLTDRKTRSGSMHSAFDFVQKTYRSQALTHVVNQLTALFEHTVDAAAIGHIIID